MHNLSKKIFSFIKEQNLIHAKDRVIVGVSGGADSVALLHILANMEIKPVLIIAHVNHLLRGKESDDDELFVKEIANKYNLAFETIKADVSDIAKKRKLSLEETGREVRYEFFRQVAEKHNANKIALAHHMDDQAETVIMRLLRGSSGKGIEGMQPKSHNNLFIRPMLQVSKSEIKEYLEKNHYQWRDDSSNNSRKFLRNRIRHELIPILQSYNPNIIQQLCNTAELLGKDELLLDEMAKQVFISSKIDKEHVMLDIKKIRSEAEAIRYRVYKQAIMAMKGDLKKISFRHIKAIENLTLSEKPNSIINLYNNIQVKRCYSSLIFCLKPTSEENPQPMDIKGEGIYQLSDGRRLDIRLTEHIPDRLDSQQKAEFFIDGDSLPFPWELRYFRDGDRFNPSRMNGNKKIKDLFIDLKIPLSERKNIPLLLSENEIFFVVGLRLAEKARPKPSSKHIVSIKISND